jgi:biotin-(acetyl-CoA carboxylase) ligase
VNGKMIAYIGVKNNAIICGIGLNGSEESKKAAQMLESELEEKEIKKNLLFAYLRETNFKKLKENFIRLYKMI